MIVVCYNKPIMKRKILLNIFVFCIFLLCFFYSSDLNASVNDFVIKDFQADYYLSKNDDNRSILKTTEKIVVQFPDIDQNHGIERFITDEYDNHPVKVKVLSVVDENGNNLSYSTNKNDNNLVIRIGDAETFVHGLKTYVITYQQMDVTKYYQDSDATEFYWDVNGLYWSQPFDKVSVRLHLEKELQDKLTGGMYCYYGVFGLNNHCDIQQTQGYISASVNSLNIGENMTIAVGFKPGTFSSFSFSNIEWVVSHIVDIMLILNIISLLIIFLIKKVKAKNHPGKGTIIPEYLPPKDTNILLSSIISRNTSKWTVLILMDLAVRHKIKILQESKKFWFYEIKKYKIEFIDDNDLDDIDKKIINSIFGPNPQSGDQYDIEMARADYKLSSRLRNIFQYADKKSISLGYFNIDKKLKKNLYIIGFTSPIISFISWQLFSNSYTTKDVDILPLFSIVSIVFCLLMISTIKPMSEKGRNLFDYLKGLKMYIKLAEADRLRVLQSPEGVQKTEINATDEIEVIHLYERLLPYAILFGLEKKWNKVLGDFYEKLETQPDWYVGAGNFNAINFASAVSNFSSYVSSSSPSSGGSSGGGSSGGGGGGGGGGGW